jgi:hypothetical protein
MIGLIIICCMLTFLVGGGYYFFKNPIIIPKIEANFLIKEIHPAERPGGSGGDAKGDYTQLSKNIDVGIQWQNDENAFGKFEEIIARRFVGGEKKKETIYKKSDYPNLFKKKKTGLQIIFYGKDNTYDITGENEVHLYYKNELGIEVQLTSSDMKKNEIKKEDLDRSLKLADSEVFTYDTTGGNTKTEADFTGKGYRMYMCGRGDMFNVVTQDLGSGVTIDSDAQNLENRKFYIVPNKDSNSKFSIKLQNALIGTVDDNGTIGLVDKLSSNVITFEMLEGSFDKSKRFKPSGTENEGKFLVYSETTGQLLFKHLNDMNEQEYKTMDIIVTEEDTYTTNMCTDTVASSQNSAGSELRLGNTYFYFTDLTNTEYKFGYYEGETSLPSEYESLNNIPTMTININNKEATIQQNGGPEVAYSVNGGIDFSTTFTIKDDDTRYRIYQKLNDEYKQKGYFEGKDVLFNFR